MTQILVGNAKLIGKSIVDQLNTGNATLPPHTGISLPLPANCNLVNYSSMPDRAASNRLQK